MNTPNIAMRQVFWLFAISRLVITLVFIPAFSEPPGNQDILLSMVAAIPETILEAMVFAFLWARYPDQTIIECCSTLLGKFIGKVVGLLYIWYFIHESAITLREFDEFVAIKFLSQTPMFVLGLGIIIMAAYVLYTGLENLGRCADVLVPYILIGIVLVVVLVIGQADWKNLFPMLSKGLGPVFYGGIPTTTRWEGLAWLAMVVPYIANKKKLKGMLVGCIVLVNTFFLIIMVPIMAVLGPNLSKISLFPTYSLVEMISVGQFLERVDAIVLGLWVFGAFLKISAFYYAAVLGASQWFGLKDQQTLIIPIGMIITILSLLLYSNIVEIRQFGKTSVFYDFIFIFVIPLFLLLMHWVRKGFRSWKKAAAQP